MWRSCVVMSVVLACSQPAQTKLKRENCSNGADDNADGKTDCADPLCANEPSCALMTENCFNGADDNNDGLTDCADLQCLAEPGCLRLEVCNNGLDDNGNGQIDCADADCARRGRPCGDGGPEAPAHCGDLLDNDNNGVFDCNDAACRGAACGVGCTCADAGVRAETNCGDSVDNDGDTRIDCSDSQCEGQSCGAGCACRMGTRGEGPCDDGQDNDGDMRADCLDSDCNGRVCAAGCVCGTSGGKREALCADGQDNDGDGRVDCADSPDCDAVSCGMGCVCAGGSKKETACADGIDNDGDGQNDCADRGDCMGAPTCGAGATEDNDAVCNDGIDNDNDGLIDCQDTGCLNRACGVGCQCVAAGKREANCGDGQDNDGDGQRDCADADCAGAGVEDCTNGRDDNCNAAVDCADTACGASVCGAGCVCGGGRARETLCGDGQDNDRDGDRDCSDSDCQNAGSEVCNNGSDDDCDGLVDCADTSCTGNGMCTNRPLGASCADSTMCSTSRCFDERNYGWPQGMCVGGNNGCSFDGGASVGCPAGTACGEDDFGRFCRPSANCRQGYSLANSDRNADTAPICFPLCVTDADCGRGMGVAGYGCNTASKRCEPKVRGLAAYGGACVSNADCESNWCYRTRTLGSVTNGGYCLGRCRTDGSNPCAAGGACLSSGSTGQVGICYDSCTATSECRATSNYACTRPPLTFTGPTICYCGAPGEGCTSGAGCCSNSCIGIVCL